MERLPVDKFLHAKIRMKSYKSGLTLGGIFRFYQSQTVKMFLYLINKNQE